MSAVVASKPQSHTGPNGDARMGTNSPVIDKRNAVKNEGRRASPARAAKQKPNTSNPSSDDKTQKPLAPPQSGTDTPDYFGAKSKFDLEPNPFEVSFLAGSSTGASDPLATPKAILPPVAALESPSILQPGTGGSSAFGWGLESLRSGPLSPAMLQGPSSGAFDPIHIARTGLTPNESGIRTGLTPGGSGSMFPAASPGAAMYQHLVGAGATPNTLEFQRTAISAAANKRAKLESQNNLTSQAEQLSMHPANGQQQKGRVQQITSDPYGQDANAAANGLYLLATQTQHQAPTLPFNQLSGADSNGMVPNSALPLNGINPKQEAANYDISSDDEMNGSDDDLVHEEPAKRPGPATRKSARKTSTANAKNNTPANRRKAEETPPKAPANKKSKAAAQSMPDFSDSEMKDFSDTKDGKKMTDEEKRKNFLERNRVAALKCRQRKKQWLSNLQTKVEYFGAENEALQAQVGQLREEIVNLKTLLLAHKDCPVSRASRDMAALQGLDMGPASMGMPPDYAAHHAQFQMGMPQSVMQNGARRFS